ncbi:MAG: FAD-dependent oxidoreductase [Gallionellales bacterium 35-53-114]|jgi:rubredoxin-NAD+ reductase|nr:MAG: FAD-dependent oxidoreductase [Gallionellales bacterium 35-53-114]OYZ63016.1 MAG: FAD-dependent oxidoreductase [Gallionellales bacterium 24-53-125]OZB09003.1 MAG: FAD-dependent oxidoreductase [Gallionellales bacterium 39-52-133]HQS59317.1 FAD-dependent oxidoreductase [Gallionellaceae bacterium]HQS76230.1 FAD-dependent oxidoreductase [Gallionellaceae bacterium]
MSQPPVVIIGSGLAGYTVAREFRKLDADTPVVMLSQDHGGFYSKPMLSNAFAQKKTADALLMKDAAKMAAEIKVEVRPNAGVTAIDPQQNQVLVNGVAVQYSKLVLALGADTIRLPLQGSGAGEVLSVNDLDDYRRFREAVDGKKDVAILGAGLIGCEFANDLVNAGFKVQVIDLAPQLLGRLLPPESAAFIKRKLEAEGVVFHLGTTTEKVERESAGFKLTLANGASIIADVVLSAVGLRPRTSLAAAAGIKTNRGIVVNGLLQTNFDNIYALGDCAEVEGRVLPYVMPIMQAARALAPILTGKSTPVHYPAMPVAVKTPACPTVVSPPEQGAQGEWKVEGSVDGVKAVFHHSNGQLLGFALMGAAVSEKAALTQQLPALS